MGWILVPMLPLPMAGVACRAGAETVAGDSKGQRSWTIHHSNKEHAKEHAERLWAPGSEDGMGPGGP